MPSDANENSYITLVFLPKGHFLMVGFCIHNWRKDNFSKYLIELNTYVNDKTCLMHKLQLRMLMERFEE